MHNMTDECYSIGLLVKRLASKQDGLVCLLAGKSLLLTACDVGQTASLGRSRSLLCTDIYKMFPVRGYRSDLRDLSGCN